MLPKNKKLIPTLALVAVCMFGFGFALVPLYDVFCEALGIRLGGDGTGRIETAQSELTQPAEDRWIRVTFDATVARDLDWQFKPDDKSIMVKVGELTKTTYWAENKASNSIVGHAVPSVAPSEASIYFAKTECFCFTEQILAAGEGKHMPVQFIIDPEIPDNLKVLTLSYRFYENEEATAALAAQQEPQEAVESPSSNKTI